MSVTGKIRKRVSVVIVKDNKVLGFFAEDPHNLKKYFFLPGGKIESGESVSQAAIRETMEETGFKIAVDATTADVRKYDFEWNGALYKCETTFLKGKILGDIQDEIKEPGYHKGIGWVSISDVDSTFHYHPEILSAVDKIIRGV